MAAAIVLTVATGCASAVVDLATGVAMPFLYREAELPPEQIELDVPYWDGDAREVGDKHRLDFFRPAASAEAGCPTIPSVPPEATTTWLRPLRTAR